MNSHPNPPAKDLKAFSFSDLLPPSLVRDLRQSLRSPLYLILIIVSLGLIYTNSAADNIVTLFFITTFVISILVPMRIGQNVSTDLRDRGTNFLKISPLTPFKIIWGQFLSAAVQILALTLLMSPLYWQFGQALMSATSQITFTVLGYEIDGWQIIYYLSVLNFLAALTMTSLQMVLALLPAFCRLGISVSILAIFCRFISSIVNVRYYGYEFSYKIDMDLLADSYWVLWGFVYAIPCLLMLARRHYASGNEVGSAFIRLWGLVYIIGTTALAYFTLNLEDSFIQMFVAVALITIVSMIDELLPRKVVIGADKSSRNSMCFLTRISPLSNWFYLMIVLVITTLCTVFILKSSGHQYSQQLLWTIALALPLCIIYTAYASLFFTNIISAYDSRRRLVVYGVCAIAIFILGVTVFDGSEIAPFCCWDNYSSLYFAFEDKQAKFCESVIYISLLSAASFVGIYLVNLIRLSLNKSSS